MRVSGSTLQIPASASKQNVTPGLFQHPAPISLNVQNKQEPIEEFTQAVQNGRFEEVQNLLQTNAVDINSYDKKGMTALMHAAKGGHIQIVDLLIRFGANLNNQDKIADNTALCYACMLENHETRYLIVESLLENGADANLTNDTGNSPLSLAIKFNYQNIMKLLYPKTTQDIIAKIEKDSFSARDVINKLKKEDARSRSANPDSIDCKARLKPEYKDHPSPEELYKNPENRLDKYVVIDEIGFSSRLIQSHFFSWRPKKTSGFETNRFVNSFTDPQTFLPSV